MRCETFRIAESGLGLVPVGPQTRRMHNAMFGAVSLGQPSGPARTDLLLAPGSMSRR